MSDVSISVAGMPDGGFLTAWRQGSDAPGAAPATLRFAALDTDGALSFNNSACVERDAALIAPRAGADFGQTGFNVGSDGRVMLAFTAMGSAWDDPNGSSVRAVSFTEKSLFPAGHPVGPTRRAAPAPAPLPPVRIPTEGVCAGDGAGQPGLPCKCDGTCAPGGRCISSSTGGTPGGFCYQDCAAGDDASCGASGMCSVVGTAARGICFASCRTTADCPAGRACDIALGQCVDFCVSDQDCEPTGLCDPYRRICVATASAGAGGLFAACRDGVECRSRHCGTSSYTKGRCLTYCRKDVAPCRKTACAFPSAPAATTARATGPAPSTSVSTPTSSATP